MGGNWYAKIYSRISVQQPKATNVLATPLHQASWHQSRSEDALM